MKTSVKILSNPKTEAQHQTNVFNWALLHIDQWPELALLFHIPNGGSRDAVEGRHLKQQGVKRGVPDLFLPVPSGRYHGLFIEMKTDTGRASREQKEWIEYLNAVGYLAQVCHGWESAVYTLEQYLTAGEVRP